MSRLAFILPAVLWVAHVRRPSASARCKRQEGANAPKLVQLTNLSNARLGTTQRTFGVRPGLDTQSRHANDYSASKS
jgi:hypothetical protein